MSSEKKTRESEAPKTKFALGAYELAVAGIFGALAIVLSITPLGLIPVPNPTGAATTLHLPAVIAGVIAGPAAGALVGLVLAIASWIRYGATFLGFAGNNLATAVIAAFLPRILIGIVSYYAYRPLRRKPTLAAIGAALAGTLTNSVGVLGILIAFGTLPVSLLVPIFSMNVPIETAVALVIAIPVLVALRRSSRFGIAGEREKAIRG
jgi:uncharacterized membrane protein